MTAAQPLRQPNQIQDWLVARIAELTSEPEASIEPDQVFDELGLDSELVVQLVGELEDWLGRELSPTLAYDFPTIASLSKYLAEEGATEEYSHER